MVRGKGWETRIGLIIKSEIGVGLSCVGKVVLVEGSDDDNGGKTTIVGLTSVGNTYILNLETCGKDSLV